MEALRTATQKLKTPVNYSSNYSELHAGELRYN